MNKFLLLVSAAALSGCGTVMESFENRAACTVNSDQAFVVSLYGPIGLASKISDKDREAICSKKESVK